MGKNPDGTANLVFGYLNRNYAAEPEILAARTTASRRARPIRASQRTFYPRRQQFMFKIKVPADFGTKELVWTLTRDGKTEKAYGTLLMVGRAHGRRHQRESGGLGNDSVTAKTYQPPTISIDPTAAAHGLGRRDGDAHGLGSLTTDSGGRAAACSRRCQRAGRGRFVPLFDDA